MVYMKFTAPNLMNAVISRFNSVTGNKLRQMTPRDPITIPCKAKNVTSSTNGKYTQDKLGDINLMEYSQFLSLALNYLPDYLSKNAQFKSFIVENPDLLYYYSDSFVMTLPSPRTRYYESVNYDDT